ncbi:MAG: Calx-beta domain-containing protein [Xanthomonadales bacterium]|nr:Calx-beta domain-containing protein [Xanthomonadales bacterium]
MNRFFIVCGLAIGMMLWPVLSQAGVSPEVNLAITDGTADEAGAETALVTVTRSNDGDVGSALFVNLSFAGTATRITDYNTSVLFNGSPLAIRINPNELETTLLITPVTDNLIEGQETIDVALQAGSGYNLGPQIQGSITLDDDVAEVRLSLDDAAAAEAGQDTAAITVSRDGGGDTTQMLRVNLEITGSATRNFDYRTTTLLNGAPLAVSIPGNESSTTVIFTPERDNEIEGTESISVALQPPTSSGYTLGAQTTAEITLTDDVAEVTLEVVDSTADEAGQDPGSFMLTRTDAGDVTEQLIVNIDLAGTADRNVDYTPPTLFAGNPFAVSIPANQLSRVFNLTPRLDNLVEGQENIQFDLQPGATYTVGSQTQAVITLADDVPVVTIEATDPDASERGLDPGTFTISRSPNGNTGAPLSINVDVGGTASLNADYTAQGLFAGSPFSVSIPGGSLTTDLTIRPRSDNPDDEGDETIEVSIQSGSYFQGAQNVATITLADLLDFLFADSYEAITINKSCRWEKLMDEQPGRFMDLGNVVVDLETELMWTACAAIAVYDWTTGGCQIRDWVEETDGYTDWRSPGFVELATLPQGCGRGKVRDAD